MSSLSIDEKMSLIQKMRSQSAQLPPSYIRETSRCTSGNTGTTLGTRAEYHNGFTAAKGEEAEDTAGVFRSLKLRSFVCLLVFSAFFGLYKMDYTVKGHKASEVNAVLQENILPDSLHNSLQTLSLKLTEPQIKSNTPQ